jgi:phosphoribosylformimino-5-aminoimidazole carboxamide ribotide isomerase
MTILPAIDLKDGKAVRLSKGLMDTAKIYSDEPWQVAKHFEKLGSEWVHLVDLNGAFAGKPENLEQIKQIRANTNLKLELGGGIRDEETIKMYLELGIDRLILGSIAVKNPDFVKKMAAKYPIVVFFLQLHDFHKPFSLLNFFLPPIYSIPPIFQIYTQIHQ